MTMEEDGEREVSELSEALAMPHAKVMKVKAKKPTTRRACVPQQAEVVVSAEARTVPCDWCRAKGHKCYS